MREKSEELRTALEEWQVRADADSSSAAHPRPRLTTGFLDGTHPVVDVYELKVRYDTTRPCLRCNLQAVCESSNHCLPLQLFISRQRHRPRLVGCK